MAKTLNTNWRALVLQADPDFVRDSRFVTEYEFSSPSGFRDGTNKEIHQNGLRIFKGDYQKRGPYATD